MNEAHVAVGSLALPGILALPGEFVRPAGVIVFAHGSGSSRLSPRNAFAARQLRDRGFATLLFDLLTEREAEDRRNVFDIALLGSRVETAVDWVRANSDIGALPVGLFGASTGAAAALVCAAAMPDAVAAVVSRGGRPDLAGSALQRVEAATLLIVGGYDEEVLELNRSALAELGCVKALQIIPGATHLFEEPGTLEQALAAASDWFADHLGSAKRPGTEAPRV